MKRYLITVIAMILAVFSAGCGTWEDSEHMYMPNVDNAVAEDFQREDIKDSSYMEEAANVSEVETESKASIVGPYGEISVSLPDNWTCEAVPVDEDKLIIGLYGLILKPERADIGQIEIAVMDSFGVCGTGLTEEEWELAGQAVHAGTYDDHEHWDFIVFQHEKPKIVAQHTNCDSWDEEQWDDAYRILDSLDYNEKKVEGGIGQYIPDSESDAIGISMQVSHITPTGLSVSFRQYEKRDAGELVYGEGYTLERLKGDAWEAVPAIIDDAVFTDIAYIIPPEGESSLEVNWEWLYGELSPGTYKITKKVLAADKGDDGLAQYTLSAQFMLAGGAGVPEAYEVDMTDDIGSEEALEYMTDENLCFDYLEKTLATEGGDEHTEFVLYRYSDDEMILTLYNKKQGSKETMDYCFVPARIFDECMALAEGFKREDQKDGAGPDGIAYVVKFMRDGELKRVSSDDMPEDGLETFKAIADLLWKEWNNVCRG